MKKLICIDLDGTILNMGNTISPKVVEILNRDEHDFLICTGRPSHEVRKFGFTGDCIASNGAEIIKDNITIAEHHLDRELIKPIVNFLEGKTEQITISTRDKRHRVFVGDIEQLAKQMVIEFKGEFIQSDFDHIYKHLSNVENEFDNVDQFLDTINENVFKIEATSFNDYAQIVEDVKETFDVNSFCSIGGHIEIVSSEVNKAKGILNYLDGENRFIAAFGDGNNDIEMFELADVSYAMENGSRELKQVAKHITRSIDEDGFVHGYNHLIDNY